MFLLLSFYIVISWNVPLFKVWSKDKLNKKSVVDESLEPFKKSIKCELSKKNIFIEPPQDSFERLWIFQLCFYITDHSIIITIAVNTVLNPKSSQLFITDFVHLIKRFHAWKKVLHSSFNMPGGYGF